MRMLLVLLSCTAVAGEPPPVAASLSDLAVAEASWYAALDASLRSEDPDTVIEAARRVTASLPHRFQALNSRRPPGPTHPPAPRPLVSALLDRVAAPAAGHGADPAGDEAGAEGWGRRSRKRQPATMEDARWACFTALARIRHTPPTNALEQVEERLGRPAALLLASFHPDVPFLRRAIEAPDPIDLAHLVAWNQLAIHDEETLVRACWSGLRLRVDVTLFEAKFGIGVPAVDFQADSYQVLGGFVLTTDPWEGDGLLLNPDIARKTVWFAVDDDRRTEGNGRVRGGRVMPLAEARRDYVRACASIHPDRGESDADLERCMKLRHRIDLGAVELAVAREQAEAHVAALVTAWSTIADRCASWGEVGVPTRHPPIDVRITSDVRGKLAAWTVEPALR